MVGQLTSQPFRSINMSMVVVTDLFTRMKQGTSSTVMWMVMEKLDLITPTSEDASWGAKFDPYLMVVQWDALDPAADKLWRENTLDGST